MRTTSTLLPSNLNARLILWCLGAVCAALPLALVIVATGGAFRQGFGEWRWAYFAMSFAVVAVTVQLMNDRPWPFYLAAVAAAGYVASAMAYAVLAWIVMRKSQPLPLSEWLFAIFLVPTHLLFVASALAAGLLALTVRKLF